MKLDDLKAAWRQELDQSVRVEGPLMTTITSDMKKIDREVRFRDFCMIFALGTAALLYLIFGWLTQENVDSLSTAPIKTSTSLSATRLLRGLDYFATASSAEDEARPQTGHVNYGRLFETPTRHGRRPG